MPEELDQTEELQQSEIAETPDGGVEVSIGEETEQPQDQVKEAEQKPQEDDSQKLKNRLGYQERQIQKLQQQLEAMSKPSQPASQPEKEVPVSELDKMVQEGRWQEAVSKLAEQRAKEIFQEEQMRIQQQSEQQRLQSEIEKNAQLALERHPELNDATSEKAQIWLDILNQNPRWRQSPDGPLLTMYRLEEELRRKGYDIDGSIKRSVESEKERIARAQATATHASRPVSSNKITLTKEQREFCDLNGIKYEDYARNLTRVGGSEVAA